MQGRSEPPTSTRIRNTPFGIADNSVNHSERKDAILLIDDEPDILEIFQKALSKNYLVDHHSDSEKALDKFRASPAAYSLVLTDIRMPRLTGFQLAREIRKIRKDIPIVFMSAFEIQSMEYKDAFPAANPYEFISKPITISRLLDLVAQHIKN